MESLDYKLQVLRDSYAKAKELGRLGYMKFLKARADILKRQCPEVTPINEKTAETLKTSEIEAIFTPLTDS